MTRPEPVGPVDATAVPRYAGPATFARLPRIDQVDQSTSPWWGCPSTPGCPTARAPGSGPPTCGRRPSCCGPTTRRWTSRRSPRSRWPTPATSRSTRSTSGEAIASIERGADELRAARRQAAVHRRRPHHRAAPAALAAPRARADRGAALRRAPRHLGHLLRRPLHPRHPVPPGAEEGLLDREHCLHIGIRGPLYSRPRPARGRRTRLPGDRLRRLPDRRASTAVVERMRARLGDGPVYVSIDIDVLDPAHAPGTGTPEAGGLTSRELLHTLRAWSARTSSVPTSWRSLRPTTTPRSPASPRPTWPTSCCPCLAVRQPVMTPPQRRRRHRRDARRPRRDTVFGIPGTHNLELYRHFAATGIPPITPRHEQGAGYAAEPTPGSPAGPASSSPPADRACSTP